jgi:hypothetical protein
MLHVCIVLFVVFLMSQLIWICLLHFKIKNKRVGRASTSWQRLPLKTHNNVIKGFLKNTDDSVPKQDSTSSNLVKTRPVHIVNRTQSLKVNACGKIQYYTKVLSGAPSNTQVEIPQRNG